MKMRPAVKRFALTLHVTSSVGWLGAVVVFLVLAVFAAITPDDQRMRAAYIAMNMLGWSVLVPFSLASLASGLVQGAGSNWGLLRHYWVLIKLLMTVIATTILLAYMQTLAYLSSVAADESGITGGTDHRLPDPSPVLHSGLALVVLLVAVTLSVYKPRGLTRYGRRRLSTSAAPA